MRCEQSKAKNQRGGLADELLVDNRLVPINSLGMGGEADEEEIREFTEKVMKNVKGVLG